MPQTGILFIDALTLVCIFLPLLPVVLIFFKSIYQNEVLNFLMILCLLNFIKGVLIIVPGLIIINQKNIVTIFALPEFIILILIFRSIFFGKIKNMLTIFLIAFLSSAVTYYLLNGMAERKQTMEILQQLIIFIIAVIGLFELINKNDMEFFSIPLSWIAIGTVFYFSISVLIKILNTLSPQLKTETNFDTQLLLNIAGFVRYLFYTFAALSYKPKRINEEKAN
jgi:hypothetical protein